MPESQFMSSHTRTRQLAAAWHGYQVRSCDTRTIRGGKSVRDDEIESTLTDVVGLDIAPSTSSGTQFSAELVDEPATTKASYPGSESSDQNRQHRNVP